MVEEIPDADGGKKLRAVRPPPVEEVAARPQTTTGNTEPEATEENAPEESPAEDQGDTMKQAAEDGTPFCEECEKAKEEQAASGSGSSSSSGQASSSSAS